MQPEAARLDELRVLAAEERIEAELALGGGAELVPELEALVAARPLQERPRAQLMLALYRAGRQADALVVFDECRRLLDDQLGLEPSARLRALERSILQHDPGLSVAAASREQPSSSIVAVPDREPSLSALLPLAEALAAGPTPRELVLARIVPAAEVSLRRRSSCGPPRARRSRHERARRGVLLGDAG